MAKKRAQTAASLAAERANLAKARTASHAKYGAGHQSAKQIAAERANLTKARAAHHSRHATSHKTVKHAVGKHHGKRIRQTTHGGLRLISNSKGLHAGAPLGTRRIKSALRHHLTLTKPTDARPRFHHTISGTSSSGGKWKSARVHHFQHHLKLRKTRGSKLRHWKRKGHRLVPR